MKPNRQFPISRLRRTSPHARRLSFDALEHRAVPAASVPTVGVYDENVIEPNTIDFVATGSSLSNTDFAGRVATAFAQDSGGVIDGSALSSVYTYGTSQARSLAVTTNLGIESGYQISGTSGFISGAHLASLGISSISGTNADEHVVTLGVTALSVTGNDYGAVTATARLARGGTMSATRQINEATKAGDTFYGFTAPANDYFIGLDVVYGGTAPDLAATRLRLDDIGFITANVPTVPPPTAANDSYSVTKNQPLAVNAPGVLANDSDQTGGTLTAQLVSPAAHGTVTLRSDGSFTYVPRADFLGTDRFTYQGIDRALSTNIATVSLNVTGPDDAPTSADDSYSIANQGTSPALVVAAPGVLANDADPNGQAITAALVAPPTHGSLTFQTDGSFVYFPAANFFGTDTFTYQNSDGQLQGNIATVTIKSHGVPVAVAENFSTPENTLLVVPASGLLANDTNPNGGTLRAVVAYSEFNGTLQSNADGSFTYMPKANFFGTDSFSYYIDDGSYMSGSVTDTITVTHVNQPPRAADDSFSIDEDSTLPIGSIFTSVQMTSQPGDYIGLGKTYAFTPANSTISFSSSKGTTVSISVTSGSISVGGDYFTYSFAAPNGQKLVPGVYANATRFSFQAPTDPGLDVSGDGRGSNTLTGKFTVYQADYDSSGNITAFAADFVQHSEGSTPALTGRVLYHSTLKLPEGLQINDIDPDDDTLAYRVIAGASHGALSLNMDGSFRYVPALGFSGVDRFTYVANDGQYDSNVATATITVNQTKFVDDAGFESVRVGSSFAYQPSGSAWMFAGSSGVAGVGSAFTAGGPAVPDGTQVAFLQKTGAITQTIYGFEAGNYVISFQAAQRGNFGASQQDFQVLVDGTVVATFRPTGTTYQSYATPAFAVAAGSHVVSFRSLNTVGGDNTALLDAVTANLIVTPPPVGDSGFETVAVGKSFQYRPSGSAWTFAGSAGVSGPGSAFTAGGPVAPEGSQVAFLQGNGSITQTIAGWRARTYRISFRSAERGNFGTSAEDFQVLVDGGVVGTFQPTGTSYQAYATPVFTVTAGSHVVSFRGLNTVGGDNTAFLDAVSVNLAAPAVGDSGFESVQVGSGFQYRPGGSAWTFAGSAGVAGPGSAFTAGGPAAPEGTQVAFLQGTGSISQSVFNWATGSYTLSFQAAQRGNNAVSKEDFQIYIDDVLVGTFQPTGTSYQLIQTKAFAVVVGKHTITFRGLNTVGGDNTTFLDDIRLAMA